MKNYFQQPFFQHIFFWVLVFACYSIANWEEHGSMTEVWETYAVKVGIQGIVTYVCLLWLIPFGWQKNKIGLGIAIFLLLISLQLVVVAWRVNYLEPTYFITHATCLERYGHFSFWQRFFNFKDVFFKNPATYLPPFFILIAIQYFQRQQKIAELNEQKRLAELNALKSQLNPHFLFNTLNNLYALALKKSDKTPEIIGKLSDILDYTLYRCNDKFVPIDKEVQLIHNYLTLEEIRYKKRVAVTFETCITQPLTIAPLLILTFIENAFKHGVKPSLNQAKIDIRLITKADKIIFQIKNPIPLSPHTKTEPIGIGLKNVKRQLNLLYPNSHDLIITSKENSFTAKLTIDVK